MYTYADQMNWEDMHFAFVIGQKGSFAKASSVLNVHHTTVARRLDALEKQLATQLFYRHTQGVTPTESGKHLMASVLNINEEMSLLGGRLSGQDMGLKGRLKITSVDGFVPLIAPYLQAFHLKHPQIDFEMIIDERGLDLRRGEADIAIRAGKKPNEADLIASPLFTSYTGIYASKTYLEHHSQPQNLNDLKKHSFVTLAKDKDPTPWGQWLKKNIPDYHISYQPNRVSGVLAGIQAGFGVGFLPSWLAKTHGSELVPLFRTHSEIKSTVWLVTFRDRYRIPRVQTCIQFLKSTLDEGLREKLAYQLPESVLII